MAATSSSHPIRSDALPYPPLALANRVGSLESAADPWSYYDDLGRRAREDLLSKLPAGWSFVGKRVLDFGCGAGRTLRHFLPEAQVAELWGCDIDAESVQWLQANLCPPLHVFQNAEAPPVDKPDASFDLIWSVSVFTHLTDTWSEWLLEMHRLLSDSGILIATFMGTGMVKLIAGEDWREDLYGMNVLRYGEGWEIGGPMVLHSPWWIREHWGRIFEILTITEAGFSSADRSVGQGVVVLRKRPLGPEPPDLEAPSVDPRELSALIHNRRQLLGETAELRRLRDHQRTLIADQSDAGERVATQEAELARLHHALHVIANSKSWRLTAPLRLLAQVARRRA